MSVCDACGREVPEENIRICRDCLCYLCPDCWEEEAYQVYDLCGECGARVAEELYWDEKLLEEKEKPWRE